MENSRVHQCKREENHTSVQTFGSSYSLGLNTFLLLSLHTFSCCDQIWVLICHHSNLVLTFVKKDRFPSSFFLHSEQLEQTQQIPASQLMVHYTSHNKTNGLKVLESFLRPQFFTSKFLVSSILWYLNQLTLNFSFIKY